MASKKADAGATRPPTAADATKPQVGKHGYSFNLTEKTSFLTK